VVNKLGKRKKAQRTKKPDDNTAPAKSMRKVARRDIAVDSVYFLPKGIHAAFQELRKVEGELKTEMIERSVEEHLDAIVEGLHALGIEPMLPRKDRKSIRLKISVGSKTALEAAAETTGLGELQLMIAALRLACERHGLRPKKP